MKTLLRFSTLALSVLLGTAAFAQPLPPYTVTVAGYVAGCTPNASVNIITVQNTQPPIDIDVPLDANCGFSVDLLMDSYQGWFMITTPCLGAIQSVTGNYTINSFFPDSNVVFVNINCGSANVDCVGITGGSALPGTPCDDNDPATANDVWSANCECEGTNGGNVDCLGVPGGPNQPGTPCTTPAGATGTWTVDCDCDTGNSGATDCLGVVNGSNMPGTSCWVFGTNTIGIWDANCNCSTSTGTPCQAGFWAIQAYGIDSLNPNGTGTPIPYEIWVWNLSTGTGNMSYSWDFGDGSTSTDPYPTHTYADEGPYWLCLTISDGTGCTSTTCDSISIDEDGILSGMIIEGEVDGSQSRMNGFTINVQNPLTTGVSDAPLLTNLALWPNPATEVLNLALVSLANGQLNVSLFDVNGCEVMRENRTLSAGRSQHTLDTSALPAGIYTVRATDTEGNNISLRFAKQ